MINKIIYELEETAALFEHALVALSRVIGAMKGQTVAKELNFEELRQRFQGWQTHAHSQLNNGELSQSKKTGGDNMKIEIEMKGYSINSKPRKDGRYQGYVRNEDTKHYVYGKTYEEVFKKLTDYANGIKKLPKVEPKGDRLQDWLEKYIKLYKVGTVRERTIKNAQYQAKLICRKFGEVRLSKLNQLELQEYFSSIKATRKREMLFNFVNAALKKAVKMRLIKHNPLDNVEFAKHTYSETKIFTKEQQEKFTLAIENDKNELTYCLILYAGLRPGEALAITDTDLDIKNKTIIVNKALAENGEKGKTKTQAGVRSVPMCKKILSLIKKGATVHKTSTSYLSKNFKKICRGIGLADFTLYSLRHSFATRCYELGMSDKTIQRLMGHSNDSITKKVYIHAQDQFIKDDFMKFDTFFDTQICKKD